MGQKIHPYGLRLGIITDWKSRWYSEKDYAAYVLQDAEIRDMLEAELQRGAVSRVEIERIGEKKIQIDIHTARPGVVIGRGGTEVDRHVEEGHQGLLEQLQLHRAVSPLPQLRAGGLDLVDGGPQEVAMGQQGRHLPQQRQPVLDLLRGHSRSCEAAQRLHRLEHGPSRGLRHPVPPAAKATQP